MSDWRKCQRMRFTRLYEELKFSDVFSAASPEEAEERKERYVKIRLKEILDEIDYNILEDGTLYVRDDLVLAGLKLKTLKDVNASRVSGDFKCNNNLLINLEGCPKKISGYFTCAENQITSLEEGPIQVGGTYHCAHNKLTNLVGAPKEIKNGNFYCFSNELTNLEGSPEFLDRDFNCTYNRLKNLQGCAKKIYGSFNCSHNPLTSLEGCPEVIDGNLILCDIQLTTLDGFPQEVKGYLRLEKASKIWNHDELVERVREVCKLNMMTCK